MSNMSIAEAWNDYAKKFNRLSNKMKKAGIDTNLLEELIGSAKNLIILKASGSISK